MSYQIKSTPFFRRMLTTSKKNGQLQRLKEEYERMKEFNDRAIEMKMRQVRLKRLFKEIEEIKDATTQYPKRRRILDRSKTLDEIRVETLIKAKELGKEYSKMNALLVGSCGKIDNYACGSKSTPKIETQKKKLMEKAVNYGNDSSRANLEKLKQIPRKKSIKREMKSMSAINESQEKLKQRLSYGNSRSSINMTKIPSKRPAKTSILEKLNPVENVKLSSRYEMSPHDIRYIPSNSDLLNRTYEELQRSMLQLAKQVEELSDEPLPRKRALAYWRKVALTVLHRFDSRERRHPQPLFLHPIESVDFRLRNIDNDTDLTQNSNETISDKFKDPLTTSDGFEDNIPNEVVLNVKPLSDSSPWSSLYRSPVSSKTDETASSKTDVMVSSKTDETVSSKTDSQPYEIQVLREPKEVGRDLHLVTSTYNSVKKNVIATEKVQKLAKIFEPFVREAAEKEVYDGVRKLKHIFEHQSNE